MKFVKIALPILLAVGAATFGGVRYMQSQKAERARIEALRETALAARSELTVLYAERVDLLEEIRPADARQIRDRTASLNLNVADELDRYDYFQNLVSEFFSKWLESPKSKKSPVVAKLKELEISINRKRAAFHGAAFEANDGIAHMRSANPPVAVFKAEEILKKAKTETRTPSH